MWKALNHLLPLDVRVRKLVISMMFGCNCYTNKKEETLDHILSTRTITCYVWKQAANIIGIFYQENERLKIKINNRWLKSAR